MRCQRPRHCNVPRAALPIIPNFLFRVTRSARVPRQPGFRRGPHRIGHASGRCGDTHQVGFARDPDRPDLWVHRQCRRQANSAQAGAAFSEALGFEGPESLELAAVVEFIHTATLLHDDVVDESALRRGRPTANAMFGNAATVLVGDFLYSRAFQMMVSVNRMRVLEVLADATNVIAEGEVLQLMNMHDPDLLVDDYLQVIRYKTAKLFEASARLGAVLAGASQHWRSLAPATGDTWARLFNSWMTSWTTKAPAISWARTWATTFAKASQLCLCCWPCSGPGKTIVP